MHHKSRRRENFCDAALNSPQFVTGEYQPIQVVPIYFPGTVVRVAIWFSRTRRRQNIQVLLLVLLFGLAGGITGGITGAVRVQSMKPDLVGIQPEETTLSIAPDEDPIEIIRVPAPPTRTRRRSFSRPRIEQRPMDEYQFIDFKQGKKGHHAEDDDGGY
jgi:hypothetical protein